MPLCRQYLGLEVAVRAVQEQSGMAGVRRKYSKSGSTRGSILFTPTVLWLPTTDEMNLSTGQIGYVVLLDRLTTIASVSRTASFILM